ncbi:MAG: hypothetical protein PHT33_00880 [bacterium]|nr:hypothetical protein [bacterium]
MSMLPDGLLYDLTCRIREAVLPRLGSLEGRASVGKSDSGDITFDIDEIAERTLSDFIDDAPLPLAYYSEDRGLVGRKKAEYTLIVDPIDGTRSANAGLEACCVSVAAARGTNDPCLGDVAEACVVEIKGGQAFTARAGAGVSISGPGGSTGRQRLSSNNDFASLRWSLELCGRPSQRIVEAVADLIDTSSLGGGLFVLNSSCYSITRLVTGQLDAYVDIGAALLEARPELVGEYRVAGRGTVMGIFPYDIAAAWLIAGEAGCIVTDALGRDLAAVRLTESKTPLSCVAASNHDVHRALISRFTETICR